MSKSREGSASDMEEDEGLSSVPSTSKPNSRTLAVTAEDLECTICLEVPASPIHTCANGHVICGICVDNVKKCGLCQSEPLHVSTLAERISRQRNFKVKCPNNDAGCRNLIACTEIKEHIPKCYYRAVTCNVWAVERCSNVSIPIQDFPRHLKEKHKCSQSGTVSRSLGTVKNYLEENNSWPIKITVKDGVTFLLYNYIVKDAVHFWMTVLADKAEAGKHMYKLTLEKVLNGKKMESCWTLPVLPYHDHPQFKDPSSLCITIPAAFLYAFSERVGEDMEYTFTMSHSVM